MQITEVRVDLFPDPRHKLLAFAGMCLDNCLAVHDMKIIHGKKGPFAALPSRKVMDKCPDCGTKNVFSAKFCNGCGKPLSPIRLQHLERLHEDVIHPTNPAFRAVVQDTVLAEYYRVLKNNPNHWFGGTYPLSPPPVDTDAVDAYEDRCLYE